MARNLLTKQGAFTTFDGLLTASIKRHVHISTGCLKCMSYIDNLNSLSRTSHILCNQTAKHNGTYSGISKTQPFLPGSAMKLRKFATSSCICRIEARKNVQPLNRINYRDFQSSCINTATGGNSGNDTDSDSDDHIRPALESVLPSVPTPTHVEIVPGKGPPPEPPVDCCMSGCANCVWIQYAEELKEYYSLDQGNKKAKEAIEQIDNPGLQMFLKVELGLL